MGEVAVFAQLLTHTEILKTIQEQVRFARARFGHYDLIDFVVVLIGYAVSGEPTLLAFYERLAPFAEPFMALFGRNQLPHRSTLSRFLAALDQSTVEALRVLYAARIGHCRSCPLRAQCQESSATIKPRRVSAVFWPLESSLSDAFSTRTDAPAPLPLALVLWKDWPRCGIRRAWLKVIRRQTVCWESFPQPAPSTTPPESVLTRAQRAHWRLSWEQRLTRNARPVHAPRFFVTLHGLPATFAHAFGFDLLATA